jgi:hypothetical protein
MSQSVSDNRSNVLPSSQSINFIRFTQAASWASAEAQQLDARIENDTHEALTAVKEKCGIVGPSRVFLRQPEEYEVCVHRARFKKDVIGNGRGFYVANLL